MLMLLVAIAILTFIYLLIISLFVLLKKHDNPVNLTLALGIILIGIWLIGVAGLLSSLGNSVVFGRFVFTSGLLGVQTLCVFVILFTSSLTNRNTGRGVILVTSAISIILAGITMTPYILASVVPVTEKLPTPVHGSLFLLYVLWILTVLGILAKYLLGAMRMARGKVRAQLDIVSGSVLIFVLLALLTNIILPELFHNTQIATSAPLSAIVLATGLSYAVIRHRILDIHLVIARAVSYLLTWAFVTIVYFVFVSTIVRSLLGGSNGSPVRQTIFIIFVIVIALSYGKVKQVFDKISNRLFYRDAYDSQQLIASVNSVIVSKIELDTLLYQTSVTLAHHIKAEFCSFYLNNLENNKSTVVGTHTFDFNDEDMNLIISTIKHHKGHIIVTDEIPPSEQKLQEVLQRYEIAVIMRLIAPHNSIEQVDSYLIFGTKKSGNSFNSQDIKIIKIISDELTLAIQNALRFDEIAQFNTTLKQEVAHATDRLRHANEKLRTLDALKDDFIATASHQLRTPASSVHDALRMLNHPSITKKDRDELIELAEASSEHLVTVVRTMLNMARIQAGHFTIDRSKADLVTIAEKVIDQVKVLAEQKNSKIDFIKPNHPIVAQIDEAKINEAFSNYIENAIKYSPAGSVITVKLSLSDREVVFEVIDQGMGVPMDERNDLFGKFYRASNARQQQPDGNGIGLYVVKCIAEGHGGEAYYHPAMDHGSLFGLSFPIES